MQYIGVLKKLALSGNVCLNYRSTIIKDHSKILNVLFCFAFLKYTSYYYGGIFNSFHALSLLIFLIENTFIKYVKVHKLCAFNCTTHFRYFQVALIKK